MDGGRAWFQARSRPIGFKPKPPASNSIHISPPKCAYVAPLPQIKFKQALSRRKEPRPKRASDKEISDAKRTMRQYLEYTPIGLLARMVNLPSMSDNAPEITSHDDTDLQEQYEHEDLQHRFDGDDAHRSYFLDSWMEEERTVQEDVMSDEDWPDDGPNSARRDPRRLLKPRDNCPSASKLLRGADRLVRENSRSPARPASAMEGRNERYFAETPPRPKSAQATRASTPTRQHELFFSPYTTSRTLPSSPSSARGKSGMRPNSAVDGRSSDIFIHTQRPMSASAIHGRPHSGSPVRPMSANAIYEDSSRRGELYLSHSLSFIKNQHPASAPNTISKVKKDHLVQHGRRYDNCGRISRGRITGDLVKLLLQETSGWGSSHSRGDQTSFVDKEQPSWTMHRRAYVMLPKIFHQREAWMDLDQLVADPHFLVRCLSCGGMATLLSSINAAVRALLLAAPQKLPDFQQLMAKDQGLDRLKQVRTFLDENRHVLQSQPDMVFQLAMKGEQGEISSLWPLVTSRATKCVEEANEAVSKASELLMKEGDSQGPEFYVDLFLTLKMLFDNGCVKCMEENEITAFNALFNKVNGQLSVLRKLGIKDFIDLFGIKTFAVWLDMLDSADHSDSPSFRTYVELNCKLQDVTTPNGREKLRSVVVRDSAKVLGISEDELAVTDVTLSGATLLSRIALDIRTVEGIAEEGPIVCFNRRPCQWESLTVYVTSTLGNEGGALQRILKSRVFPSIRRLCGRRAVEFEWVDLEESGLGGGAEANENGILAEWAGNGGSRAVRRDIFLVLLLPHDSSVACTVERQDNLFFLSSARSQEERVVEEAAMLLSDCLWGAIEDKYPVPTEAECNFETEAQTQLREMEEMAGNQTFLPSRAVVMKTLIAWIRSDLERPMAKRMHGAEGSGKSFVLAAIASGIMQEGQLHVIYFRFSRRHTSEDFISYLCSSLSTGKERFASVERAGHLLAAVGSQQQVLLIFDGLTPTDESHVQQIFSRKRVAALKGGVRCIYTSALPSKNTHEKEGSWVIPPLTVAERSDLFQCSTLDVGVKIPEQAKQAVLSKKHSTRPMYVTTVARILGMMTSLLGWHRIEDENEEATQEDAEKADFIIKLCEHLPGELSSLMEEGVITLLERQHGQALVRRVLEHLFHCPGGLSPFQMTWMMQQHSDISGAVVYALCSDLWPFLGCASAELQMEHGPMMQAVARRYFEDYVMDDKEARSLIERNELAMKAAEEAAVAEEAARRAQAEDESNDMEDGSSPSALKRTSSMQSVKNAVRMLPTSSSGGDLRKQGPYQLFEAEGLAHLAWTEERSHPGGVLSMASFHEGEDSSVMCTGGFDGTIKVWDATSHVQGAAERLRRVRELRGELDSDVDEITLKGERGINAYMRKFWLHPHVLVVLKGHTGGVYALLASDDLLYSGSADSTIRVWSRRTWRTVNVLKGHRSIVTQLTIGDGRLYSASHDGRVLMWDAQKGERIGTLDAMKRACINTVLLNKNRLLSGTERRWNEDMNTIKVWSADAMQSLDELPSKAMQRLVKQIKNGEAEETDALQRVKHMAHRMTKLRSPIKRTELQEQIKQTKQKATATNSQIEKVRQKVESMRGGVCHRDDVYCLHVIPRIGEDGHDVLFTGGIGHQILAWDLKTMTCIEAMEDKTAAGMDMAEQYTKCITSDAMHLYSGGGWHQAPGKDVVGKPLGCVRVWNLQSRKLVGSMSHGVPVLTIALAGETLAVGDVNGDVMLFVRGERVEAFRAKMESQIQVCTEMTDTLRQEFTDRRAAVQSADNLTVVREHLQRFREDCSLQACLLLRLSNHMILDGQWESPEGEIAGATVVLKAIARYPNHPRLQIAALDALSHLMSSKQVADRVLASKSFLHVTNVVARMTGYPSIQQAVCLLMWEVAVMDAPVRIARPGQGNTNNNSRTRQLLNSGAITTLLAAIDDQPMNLPVLNVALPLLRLLAVREPEECKALLEAPFVPESAEDHFTRLNSSGKEIPLPPRTRKPLKQILDELENNMDEIRIIAAQPGVALHDKMAFQAVGPLSIDLTAVQGKLQLRLNGKPVQQPQAVVTEKSSLHGHFFNANMERYRRAKHEIWEEMAKRAAVEWTAAMQRQQEPQSNAEQPAGWSLARLPSTH